MSKYYKKDSLSSYLRKSVEVLELIVAMLLALAIFFGLLYFINQFLAVLKIRLFLNANDIHSLLDTVLVIFIAIELFRISLAYFKGTNVLLIVIEAGLVAMARKIVLYDFGKYGILEASALAMLTVSLIISYAVLVKTYHREP